MVITFDGIDIDIDKIANFSIKGSDLLLYPAESAQAIRMSFATESRETMDMIVEYVCLCCESDVPHVNLDKFGHWVCEQQRHSLTL